MLYGKTVTLMVRSTFHPFHGGAVTSAESTRRPSRRSNSLSA